MDWRVGLGRQVLYGLVFLVSSASGRWGNWFGWLVYCLVGG